VCACVCVFVYVSLRECSNVCARLFACAHVCLCEIVLVFVVL